LKTRTRWCALLASVIVAGLVGCSGKEEGKTKPAPDKAKDKVDKAKDKVEPAPIPTPKYDAAEISKMLQGKWTTGKPDNLQATFVFTGDQAEVTTHKQIDSATNKPFVHKGKLEISGANELTIRSADGNGYVFSFVKIADQLHLSVGGVHWVDNFEDFRLELNMREILAFGPKGCKWSVDFAGKNESRDVVCAIEEKDGKKVFKYQSPDAFDKTKLSDSYLFIADKYLVSDQVMGDLATKVE
jgi:hypothetical protein